MIKAETTIILADDHPLMLKGIISALQETEKYKILGSYNIGKDALESILHLKPELAIIDIQMPMMNGIEVLKVLKEKKASTKVIVFTMFRERYLLKQALNFNAKGYLIKDTVTEEIKACLSSVKKGEIYVSKSMDASNDTEFASFPEYDNLTRMEKKVFNLVRQSMTSKEIAEELFLSVKTIENHRYNIGKKLNIQREKNDLLKFLLKKIN